MKNTQLTMLLLALALLGASCASNKDEEVSPQEEHYTDEGGEPERDDPFGRALKTYKAGNYEQALEKGAYAVEVYREEGTKEMVAKTLLLTGLSREKLADYSGAVIDYHTLLDEEAGDPQLNLSAYKNTAVLYQKFREYSKALHYNEKALEIAGKHLPEEKAAILYNMGNVCKENDAIAKAIVYYQSARELALEAADYQLAAKANLDLGISFKAQGNYEEARAFYQKIIADQENLQEHYSKYAGMAYQNIGAAYMEEGKLDEAIKSFRKALELKKGGDSKSLFISHLDLGDCYSRKGKTKAAIAEWETALRYYPEPTEPDHFIIHKHLADAQKEQSAKINFMSKYSDSWEAYNRAQEDFIRQSQNEEDKFRADMENYDEARARQTDTYQTMAIFALLILVLVVPYGAVEAYRWWIGRSLSKKIRAILDKNPNV